MFNSKFKNINIISSFLLILIIFIMYVFVHIQQINKNEKDYKIYHNKLCKLIILDKSFDAFLLNQRKIVNYDKIVTQTDDFKKIIEELIRNNNNKNYEKHIHANLEKIYKLFVKKSDLIERFKSYNATSLYTLAYILDLKKVIDKSDNTTPNKLFSDLLSNLMKSYLNFGIDKNELKKDINQLSSIKNKSKNLDFFYINIKSVINKLEKISKIKTEAMSIPLEKNIINIQQILDTQHNKVIAKQNKITAYMLLFIFILLIVLFYFYISSVELQKKLTSFQYAVQNSDDSIVITDVERHIIYVNDAFTENTGYSKEEALGKNPNILKSGKMPDEFYRNMNQILDRGEKWSGDFINKDKSGKIYYEKASITPMFTNNRLTGYLAIKLNITNYMKEQEKVKFLAYHDSLTNLPNRRMMKRIISEQLNNFSTKHFSLFFLDLDGFKNINDTLGHDIGDKLLIEISKKLKNYIKQENKIFRTGGDEFAIVEYSSKKDRSKTIARDILKLINEPIIAHNNILRVGVSIGIAKFQRGEDSLIALLKHADIAMYEAKKEGKNRYRYYTKDLSIKIDKKIKIEQKLLTALKNNSFYVVYQPKYYLKTHKIRSLEALIRWQDEELGLIPPDLFIPIAEEVGLINKIGEFVFKQACEDFKSFTNKCKSLTSVSINVSPAQFMDNKLIEKLKKIIEDTRINPKNIGIEITETHLMQNIKDNSKLLYKLKNLGCKIIIDDFGTGYSSLNYLKKLPIDNLKIDKSFIDDICVDENDKKIVKAIVGISKSFNYMSVAEGIETKEQENLLIDMGIEIGQGYLFSKPKTKEELLEFLESTCRG